jgi:hypothetical protein
VKTMGRSLPAYSCPCGFSDIKSEFSKHKKKCKTLKTWVERDNQFKKSLGLR